MVLAAGHLTRRFDPRSCEGATLDLCFRYSLGLVSIRAPVKERLFPTNMTFNREKWTQARGPDP